MLKSICLKNWRSHKDTKIDFTAGTNLIIGRMGGGKTSVISAICFALFGTTPDVQHRRLKLTDIIRNRPSQQNESEVELTFSHKGEIYTVKRTIKTIGGSEAEIRKNGQLVEGPQPQRANEFISDLLELDYDLFTRAVYSEQNRIDYFLTLPKGERKKQIDDLIGITKFETVRANAVTAVSRMKNIYSDKELILQSFDRSKIEKEINEIDKEIKEINEKISVTEKKVDLLKDRKREIKKEFERLNKDREKNKELIQIRAGLTHTTGILKEETEREKFDETTILEIERKIVELKGKKSEINSKTIEIDEIFNNASKKYGEIERRRADVKSLLERKRELLEKLNQILETDKIEKIREKETIYEKRISELSKQIAEANAIISELEKAIIELKKEIARCPICDSELSAEKRISLLKTKDEKRAAISKNLEKLTSENKIIESERIKIQTKVREATEIISRLKEFEGIEIELGTLSDEKIKAKSDFESIKKERENLKSSIENATEEINRYTKQIEKIDETKNKIKKLESLSQELISVESKIKAVSFDENVWNKTNEKIKEIEVKETKLRGEIITLTESKKHFEERINDKENRLREAKKYQEEIERYSKMIEKLQIFSNAIVETQQSLREELIEAVNEALSEVWNVLYPYSDYPAIKLVPSEKDYELVFRVNGEWIAVDGIGSGGERALASLALRVAFAMVLTPNLSWLILDEPTHNLDEEAVRTLATTLHDHIPNIVEQTFVITHDENLKDAASGKLFKVDRSKSVPEISVAEEII